MILEWVWFGHSYGIGISLDWTLLSHVIIYGLTVPVVAFLMSIHVLRGFGWKFFKISFDGRLECGLVTSMTAALYLELLQMWQYHWTIVNGDHVGMGDPLDLLLSWGSAYMVYWILRNRN